MNSISMKLRPIIIISQLISILSFVPHIKHHKSTNTLISETTSPTAAKSTILDTIQSIFQKSDESSSRVGNRKEIENAKSKLLLSCREGERNRNVIEDLISELESLSPMQGTAKSGNLQREWKMEWTTEKEINIFIDWKISNNVYQTISGKELKNGIEFQNGGGLFVSGSLSIPEDDMHEGKRTNFKFTTALLDLGKWGTYTIPPVGEGWFETIYLDDNLRVDTNSRNDILICTCA